MVKFRAWHVKEKKMCEVETLSFNRKGKIKGAFLVGVEPAKDIYSHREITIAPTHGRYCTAGEFNLLQYSGLGDYYEGDLLEAPHGVFMIKKDLTHSLTFVIDDGLHAHGYFTYGDAKRGKLIGNIYQTPELIPNKPWLKS